MTCRTCGTTIADKAIVCYRCGTPTAALPAAAPRSGAGRRSLWPLLLVLLAALAGVAWWLARG